MAVKDVYIQRILELKKNDNLSPPWLKERVFKIKDQLIEEFEDFNLNAGIHGDILYVFYKDDIEALIRL